MTELDRAQKYLDAIPAATEGGRNDALNGAAYAVAERFSLSATDFEFCLTAWAARCIPPIPPVEASKTIRSAWHGASRKGAAGAKRSIRHVFSGTETQYQPSQAFAKIPVSAPPMAGKARHYDLSAPVELPKPIANGCREFLLAAFVEGEGVSVAQEVLSEEAGKGIPKDKGIVLTREQWLEKLDKAGGDPNKLMSSSDKTGAFVRVNPLTLDGSKDTDVTAFRHALLEFDKISVDEQWNLIQQSQVPCSAVIHSGNKSLHAWVKIDARDRAEYDTRVSSLYDHFSAYIETDATGKAIDRVRANKNPSRFSRLPGMIRGKSHQSLLAINQGSESFLGWMMSNNMSSFSKRVTIKALKAFKSMSDPDCILGNRWICKGGSCLVVGQSGIGKSSLNMQAALTWACGLPFFGIEPRRQEADSAKKEIKSLIVQAENDIGDLAEMYQGVSDSLTSGDEQQYQNFEPIFERNCIFENVPDKAGQEFLIGLANLVDKYKPDLCWLDPLLAFAGDDITKQVVMAKFLREGLNHISKETGVAWMIIHHTGKPPKDQKTQKDYSATDFAYLGFGSSDIVNWARAVTVLRDMGEGKYNLKLAKRGERAGAKDLHQIPTIDLMLKHADHGICWHQIEAEKEGAKHTVKHEGRKKKYVVRNEFLESIQLEHFTRADIIRRIIDFEGCSEKTAETLFSDYVTQKKLIKDEDFKTYSAAKTEPEKEA